MNQTLNNCVRAMRQEHKMTQKDLADAVGVTRQTIIAIERGNYTPSVALAIKIARTFNVSCDTIFSLE